MSKNTTKPSLTNKEIEEMHLKLSILREEKQKYLLEKADLKREIIKLKTQLNQVQQIKK